MDGRVGGGGVDMAIVFTSDRIHVTFQALTLSFLILITNSILTIDLYHNIISNAYILLRAE